MLGIAVTLSCLMQTIISVCHLLSQLAIVNIPFAAMRFLKNAGSQAENQISDLCSTFVELRQKFLGHTSITTGISVFQILDDVGVLSAQVSGISTQLIKMTIQLSNQILDLGT